ncbi:MAG: glycosyltransferase family 2 protein [Candidatus Heimdallarchaeota archaeon]|nr:glycosyltransferase family 2 protein [Candidatus Heimdallarchaeota archaeon]MDH5645331.1 glycosyltransferase family 2 protein [Candidatus Heimdallarchaeota archaeon]
MELTVIINIIFVFFFLTSLNYVIFLYPNFLKNHNKLKEIHNEEEVIELLLHSKRKINLVIQITTKGGEMEVISEGLLKLNEVFLELHNDIQQLIRVFIVTERENDLILCPEVLFPVEIIVVPKSYTTNNQTRLKARALQYMVEYYNDNLPGNLEMYYIYHFDAESQTDKFGVLSVLYSILINPDVYIFQGLITYPIRWFRAPLFSRQLESLRPWNCYECRGNTNNGIIYHLHGSNIVIRGDKEYQIGWDFGLIHNFPVVAEDLFFGLKAYLILGKQAFGWHGGVLYEQPALSLVDSLKQRIRWIRGSLQALDNIDQLTSTEELDLSHHNQLKHKMRVKLYIYGLGFIPATIASITYIILISYTIGSISYKLGITSEPTYLKLLLQLLSPNIHYTVIIFTMIGGILWLLTIQIGLHLNFTNHQLDFKDKTREHLLILLITPIAVVFDTGVVFFTIIFWKFGYKKAIWEITPKIL